MIKAIKFENGEIHLNPNTEFVTFNFTEKVEFLEIEEAEFEKIQIEQLSQRDDIYAKTMVAEFKEKLKLKNKKNKE